MKVLLLEPVLVHHEADCAKGRCAREVIVLLLKTFNQQGEELSEFLLSRREPLAGTVEVVEHFRERFVLFFGTDDPGRDFPEESAALRADT